MNWIDLAQNRYKRMSLVKGQLIFGFHNIFGNFHEAAAKEGITAS
jgi:hypothetical protein